MPEAMGINRKKALMRWSQGGWGGRAWFWLRALHGVKMEYFEFKEKFSWYLMGYPTCACQLSQAKTWHENMRHLQVQAFRCFLKCFASLLRLVSVHSSKYNITNLVEPSCNVVKQQLIYQPNYLLIYLPTSQISSLMATACFPP